MCKHKAEGDCVLKRGESKQMKLLKIKTLNPDISALVYQKDQSWFLTDLFLIFGVELGLLVLFGCYFIYINRSGLRI